MKGKIKTDKRFPVGKNLTGMIEIGDGRVVVEEEFGEIDCFARRQGAEIDNRASRRGYEGDVFVNCVVGHPLF